MGKLMKVKKRPTETPWLTLTGHFVTHHFPFTEGEAFGNLCGHVKRCVLNCDTQPYHSTWTHGETCFPWISSSHLFCLCVAQRAHSHWCVWPPFVKSLCMRVHLCMSGCIVPRPSLLRSRYEMIIWPGCKCPIQRNNDRWLQITSADYPAGDWHGGGGGGVEIWNAQTDEDMFGDKQTKEGAVWTGCSADPLQRMFSIIILGMSTFNSKSPYLPKHIRKLSWLSKHIYSGKYEVQINIFDYQTFWWHMGWPHWKKTTTKTPGQHHIPQTSKIKFMISCEPSGPV